MLPVTEDSAERGPIVVLDGEQSLVDGEPAHVYDAFISYSQRIDKVIAKRVRKGVQTIGKPFWRRRASRVFLDASSLSASHTVWGSLAARLDESRTIIFLASEPAAQSPWVNNEVEHFMSRPGAVNNFLIALTDGEIIWDNETGDFDPELTTACPPGLYGRYEEEPLYVDVRWMREAGPRDRRRERGDISTIAAAVRGCPKDEIIGDDIRQQRRNLALASAAAVVLALLSVLAVLFMLQARQSAKEATSTAAGALGISQIDGRLDQALLLAEASVALERTTLAEQSLLETLIAAGPVERFAHEHQGPVRAIATSADGLVIVSAGEGGQVLVSDATLDVIGAPIDVGGPVLALAVDPAAQVAVVGSHDGWIRTVDLSTGSLGEQLVIGDGSPIRKLVWSPTTGGVIVGTDSGELALASPQERRSTTLKLEAGFSRVDGLDLSANGATLLVSGVRSLDGAGRWLPPVVAVDLATLQVIAQAASPDDDMSKVDGVFASAPASANVVKFDPVESTIVWFGTFDGSIVRWDLTDGDAVIVGRHQTAVSSIWPLADSERFVATSIDGDVTVWNSSTRQIVDGPWKYHGGQVWTSALADGGSALVTGGQDTSVALVALDRSLPKFGKVMYEQTADGFLNGVALLGAGSNDSASGLAIAEGSGVSLVDGDTGNRSSQLLGPSEHGIVSMAYSPASGELVVGHRDGTIVIWDPATGQLVRTTRVDVEPDALTIHPDGTTIAIGGRTLGADGSRLPDGSGSVIFVESQSGELVNDVIAGLDGATLKTLAFSVDGERLLLSGTTLASAVLSWPELTPLTMESGVPVDVLGGAFGVDGRLVVADQRQGARLLTADGQGVEPLRTQGNLMTALAFSPDGSVLATGSVLGDVTLWDVGDRADVIGRDIPGHTSWVRAAVFEADGTSLLTISGNELIRWNLDIDALADLACRIANRPLEDREWDSLVGRGSVPSSACLQ